MRQLQKRRIQITSKEHRSLQLKSFDLRQSPLGWVRLRCVCPFNRDGSSKLERPIKSTRKARRESDLVSTIYVDVVLMGMAADSGLLLLRRLRPLGEWLGLPVAFIDHAPVPTLLHNLFGDVRESLAKTS